MKRDECIQWVSQAIKLAIERDGSSGGEVDLICIEQEGARAMQAFRVLSLSK